MQAVSIEADRWGQQRKAWLSHSLLARGAPGGKRKVILALGETTEQSPLTIYSVSPPPCSPLYLPGGAAPGTC